MKIVVAHNFYQQPGGEDQVFAAESALLEQHGHSVVRFTVHNDELNGMGNLALARNTIWNRSMAKRLAAVVQEHRPEVVHFHNTFPLTSPAAYRAARRLGPAVVQTLHNYRLICPAATMLREGSPCSQCLNSWIRLPAIAHKCYRGSRGASAVTAAMLNIHRTLGTYRRHVDLYLAVSEFMRDQYLAGGFRPEQVVYKPNFVQDPGIGAGDGGYALFVGRLTEEKGLPTLLEAWRTLNGSIKLKIVGDGPLREKVQAAAATSYGIEYLGRQPSAEVHRLMQAAAMLVFPSTWFEGQPLTIIESLACGTPVLASDLGAMATMITPGRTGSLFTPGDPAALAKEASRLFADRSQLQPMRPAARADYERHYTPAAVYRRLMDCYENALQRRRSAAAPVAFPAAN